MFKATLQDAKIIRGIFDAVSAIITQTQLKVTPEGIKLNAMDNSHICLVSLFLAKEDLDEFNVDQEYSLGINMEDLVKILKRSGSNDGVTFTFNPDNNRIVIEIKPQSGKGVRKFSIGLIETDSEAIPLDALENMEFQNKLKCPVTVLDDGIKDAEIFADVLQIKVMDGKLNFSTTGNIGDMDFDVDPDKLESAELEEESTGVYAISFLKNILKPGSINPSIQLELGSNLPLKAIYSIMGSSQMMYLLAPRVEDDDDSMYDD